LALPEFCFAHFTTDTKVNIKPIRSRTWTNFALHVTLILEVALLITFIVSVIPKNAVVITHNNQKFTSELFSLNHKYVITKFLNLKLLFHQINAPSDMNIINIVLK
jgi:hypothetical protein